MRSEFSGKHLLLVGTGGVKRRRVMEALRALGLARITCLHDGANWAAPYVDDWIVADPVEPSVETVNLVRTRLPRVDGVWTYDDYSVVLAAHLARAFGLVGLDPDGAAQMRDKAAFRRACTERGLPAPRSVRLDPAMGEAAAALVAAGIAYPVVIKPTHGAGSVLVRRIDGAAQLAIALREYDVALANEPASSLWPDRGVLVEEYIAGPEVDIDMIVQRGELRYAAVTDNVAPEEPYFMERGGELPSRLPDDAQRALADVACAVLRAFGIRDGCVHFEARWTAKGAMPIEANLRLGGAEVYELNRSAFEIDLVEAAVRVALGLEVPTYARGAAARCHLRSTAFNAPRSGVIRGIALDTDVRASTALGEVVVFRPPGDRVRVPPDGFDYCGWLVARGATADEAEARLRELAAGVRFDIGDGPAALPRASPMSEPDVWQEFRRLPLIGGDVYAHTIEHMKRSGFFGASGDTLEIGGGDGEVWRVGGDDALAAALAAGRLVVTDRDADLVARCAGLGHLHRPGIVIESADVTRLQYRDCSFARVVAVHVLHWCATPDAIATAIHEIARVLRDDGRALVVTVDDSVHMRELYDVMRRAKASLARRGIAVDLDIPRTSPRVLPFCASNAPEYLSRRFESVRRVDCDYAHVVDWRYQRLDVPGHDFMAEYLKTLPFLRGVPQAFHEEVAALVRVEIVAHGAFRFSRRDVIYDCSRPRVG